MKKQVAMAALLAICTSLLLSFKPYNEAEAASKSGPATPRAKQTCGASALPAYLTPVMPQGPPRCYHQITDADCAPGGCMYQACRYAESRAYSSCYDACERQRRPTRQQVSCRCTEKAAEAFYKCMRNANCFSY